MNYLKKSELKRREMKQIDYRPTSPILVDGDYNILFGNSLYGALPEEVSCLLIPSHPLNKAIQSFEDELVTKDNAIERLRTLDESALLIIRDFGKEAEENLMFDFMQEEEEEVITKENYNPPPPPSWTKKNLTKNELYEKGEQFLL